MCFSPSSNWLRFRNSPPSFLLMLNVKPNCSICAISEYWLHQWANVFFSAVSNCKWLKSKWNHKKVLNKYCQCQCAPEQDTVPDWSVNSFNNWWMWSWITINRSDETVSSNKWSSKKQTCRKVQKLWTVLHRSMRREIGRNQKYLYSINIWKYCKTI